MTTVHERFNAQVSSVNRYPVTATLTLVSRLLVGAIIIAAVVLTFTPWIQTAYGTGEVNTLSPNHRTQAISALVPGQVEQWHVREGQYVERGDPIVTLVDADPQLIARLDNQIASAEQQRDASASALETEQKNFERQQRLRADGLASQRDIEKVSIRLQELRGEIAKIDAELSKMRVQRARQSLQTKRAPADGYIMQLLSAGNATYVKAGDIVASFIPNGVERSVALTVSGMDAPLVMRGRKVRLQFEGWPMFQVSGWPDAATGTFGGIVEFIEPMAQPDGRFRVWVREDKDDIGWPDERFVRMGSRVKGWILLEEVSLGYEMWRQLNNFPPVNRTLGQQK